MKKFILPATLMAFLVTIITSVPLLACDQREAQIIATVISSEKLSTTSCLAKINTEGVRLFNGHIFCPLSLGEVALSGIEVGFKDGYGCQFKAGDEISGIVYANQDGQVKLD
jgi:hypothetical protein